MENSVAEKFLRNLEAELTRLDEMDLGPIERLRQAIPIINRSLSETKRLILESGFTSTREEVSFFKHIKPRMYAHQIFEVLFYNLRVQTPVGTPEMLKAYYEEELQQIFRLFRVEAFPYQYFKMESTELDHIYFVRDAKPLETPLLDIIDPLPGFSTAWDYKFANFMAHERLRDLLVELLTDAQPSPKKRGSGRDKGIVMKWTGDAINLVEIAYGIWLTGQINHGNAGIAEIVQFLEANFQVNIGRPFRRWQAISNRKRLSQVKYVEQMKMAILKRLDDENA
jgi:hypothetical protein